MSPFKAKIDSEEEENIEDSPPRPPPAVVTPLASKHAPALEYSAMEEESDNEEGSQHSPGQIESRSAVPTSTQAPTSRAPMPNHREEATRPFPRAKMVTMMAKPGRRLPSPPQRRLLQLRRA